jgi:archaellum component FlaG (FlaF/FlaG flagellin family)
MRYRYNFRRTSKKIAERSAVSITMAVAFALLMNGCSKPSDEASSGFHAGDQLTSLCEQITSPVHEFQVKADGEYTLDVEVKNTGKQPWFGDSPTAPVRLSYR